MPGKPPAESNRRAEPINKHVAKNGTVTYWFQVDIGSKPDGTRDRPLFTYPTLTEARREYRRIKTEVARDAFAKVLDLTVNEACDQWLAGRRGIRRNSLGRCRDQLTTVRRFLGGKKMADLTKEDGDALVEWMLTEGRRSPRQPRPDSLVSRVAQVIGRHHDAEASKFRAGPKAFRPSRAALSSLFRPVSACCRLTGNRI